MSVPATPKKETQIGNEVIAALRQAWNDYCKSTHTKLKIIDVYLVYIMLTGVILFVYGALSSGVLYPVFLAGFGSCVSCFVIAGNEWSLI